MEPKINQAMNKYLSLILGSIFLTSLISCEDPYFPEPDDTEQVIVVEGYIEAGENTNPTFVLVTKSIPFFSNIEADQFSKLFVNDAIVVVNDGIKDVPLTKLCLNDIPEPLREEALNLLGFDPDSVKIDLCLYVDLLDQIDRREGGKYDLSVKVGEKVLTATTTIPRFVGLHDFVFKPTPGIPSDTMSQLFTRIQDPADEANYYRYFTATGGEGYIAPFTSVTNDNFFNGKDFEFPIARAQRRGQGFNPDTFGYFRKGDTIAIKSCNIDKAHFDFWNTHDFSNNSGGPFASYTRIQTNIKGGLGIWGGYAVGHYELVVPE
jgi:Domain of unknown function (DUF4249)